MMGARWLLLAALFLSCVGAAPEDRPSLVGATTIAVWYDAQDVVLVDPLGRVSRHTERAGERAIPGLNRWDGGTGTDLDDSTGGGGVVIVTFDLNEPIVGKYRLYATLPGSGKMTVVVTPLGLSTALRACREINGEVADGSGRYFWNIQFLADSSRARCPIRISRAVRRTARR